MQKCVNLGKLYSCNMQITFFSQPKNEEKEGKFNAEEGLKCWMFVLIRGVMFHGAINSKFSHAAPKCGYVIQFRCVHDASIFQLPQKLLHALSQFFILA
ncbi:hypothetical protein CEXT_441301 [Caerostris extrusa]|uniref:Uncharacterized protein n=1 Tax=Caerostris extrusa TaxID=172846 RepID=A0AAV4XLF7_CAEEX|nr:hypothetical protein CEXT_441301 [Caerostris extrusa]